jgi:hypothetical protein
MTTNAVAENGLAQKVGAGVHVARAEIDQIDEQVRAFVRERPVVALFGAVGIGYFVARALSRL